MSSFLRLRRSAQAKQSPGIWFAGFAEATPEQWLQQWSSVYPALAGYDDAEYYDILNRHESLKAPDYERIGRWKDNATSDAKWKPNIASVAYEIWLRAAAELPRCPPRAGIADFLTDWSERQYRDEYRGGIVRVKSVGLSRASTLLHFISGGQFQIFDSRVAAAVLCLTGRRPEYTVAWYVNSFCGIFEEIAARCNTVDGRVVDKALFCYGAFVSQMGSIPEPLSDIF